jgi:crotonobetainyl-CoA:carnitine CoA-transferase CaiB-like acyl-CoA transferase
MGGVCVVDRTSVIEKSCTADVLAGISAVVIKIESAGALG